MQYEVVYQNIVIGTEETHDHPPNQHGRKARCDVVEFRSEAPPPRRTFLSPSIVKGKRSFDKQLRLGEPAKISQQSTATAELPRHATSARNFSCQRRKLKQLLTVLGGPATCRLSPVGY